MCVCFMFNKVLTYLLTLMSNVHPATNSFSRCMVTLDITDWFDGSRVHLKPRIQHQQSNSS